MRFRACRRPHAACRCPSSRPLRHSCGGQSTEAFILTSCPRSPSPSKHNVRPSTMHREIFSWWPFRCFCLSILFFVTPTRLSVAAFACTEVPHALAMPAAVPSIVYTVAGSDSGGGAGIQVSVPLPAGDGGAIASLPSQMSQHSPLQRVLWFVALRFQRRACVEQT